MTAAREQNGPGSTGERHKDAMSLGFSRRPPPAVFSKCRIITKERGCSTPAKNQEACASGPPGTCLPSLREGASIQDEG